MSPTLISDVAEKVTPAVVNVLTKSKAEPQALPFEHPMLRNFLGPEQQRRMPMERGAGSGVIISADGLIVTNNHVIDHAEEIKVTLADKREFTAKLIGTDKASDVALIKIQATGLPHLQFGDSSALRLGEIVLAIGNPFGVGQTVTMGIVSAKGKTPQIGNIEYEDFIQTDAAINPGNSGGALVNLKGELVGINTAILGTARQAAGVAFAVPSNMVRPIREQIMQYGRVRRGWIGVAIQDITPELARSMKINDAGVLISDVLENGPAAKAKIQAKDVILKVDDHPTTTASELRNFVAMLRPGSNAKVSLVRDGKKMEVSVLLSEKKDESVAEKGEQPGEERLLSGIEVRELDGELRSKLNVPPRVSGVVVMAVAPDSAADSAGLDRGHVIVSVDGDDIKTVGQFEKALAKKDKTEALLRVWADGVFSFKVLRK